MIERTLEIEASLDSLRTVGLWMRDATRAAGVPYEVAFGIDLAVHEAVENVVRHGGESAAQRSVKLRFRCDRERVDVEIEDDGSAFDPLTVPAPAHPQRIEDVVPGGQGIHLMRHFTDEVRYRRDAGRNVLTLTRRLTGSRRREPVSVEPVLGSPFFKELRQDDVRVLLRVGRVVRLDPGTVVLRPGERNRALYFVLSGALEVRLEAASRVVSRIEAGECFGEMSLLDGQPASAWVTVAEPCELLCVSEERVFSDLLPQPGFARGLLRLMSGRLRATLDREATWEGLRKELRLAREQASMLPPAGLLFLDHPEIDCAAAMDAAAEVGGDFYEAFFLDERRLFFAVGDVAGKGIGAALFMARSLALLRAEALRRRPLHELLGRVNEALSLGNEQATFVALTCGVFDTASGTLRVANGGGGAPFLRDERGWQRLPMPRGIVVGAMPGFVFETARTRLAPGEALVLFSDGVTEARNPAGELFGTERLRTVLAAHEQADAAALVTGVREAVAEFAGAGPPADDLTLFALRRSLAPPPPPPSTPPDED